MIAHKENLLQLNSHTIVTKGRQFRKVISVKRKQNGKSSLNRRGLTNVVQFHRITPTVELISAVYRKREALGSNPARNNFFPPYYYNFGAYLYKYKLQLYYFKLVHCGIMVTMRASQVLGFNSGPGSTQFPPLVVFHCSTGARVI